jgi:hypothetical protein
MASRDVLSNAAAAVDIAKNTRIIDYAGELIRNDEACERPTATSM